MDRRNDELCKLVINNLGSSHSNERVLSDIFCGFGNIAEIFLKSDYCIIQYDRPESVDRAIRSKDGMMISGRRVSLRSGSVANEYRRRSPSPKVSRDRRHESPRGLHGRGRRSNSRSPITRRERSSDKTGWERDRPLPYARPPREMSPYGREALNKRSCDHRKLREEPIYERNRESGHRTSSNLPAMPLLGHLEPGQLNLIGGRPYDVAVVAMDHSLLNFAESIEARIHRQAVPPLVVHIIVLREEAHVTPCIQDLTRKGVLMACVVGHQNEQHDSCTLRILHGTSQEHRNMPLDDAMKLMRQHFDDLLQCLTMANGNVKSLRQTRNNSLSRPVGYVPPTERQSYLLNLLADGRMLTLDELSESSAFINERISALGGGVTQVDFMYGGQRPVNEGDVVGGRRAQTDELKSKILSMINPAHSSVSNAPDPLVHQQMRENSREYSDLIEDNVGYAANDITTNINSANSLNLSNPKVKEALNKLAPLFPNGNVSSHAQSFQLPPRNIQNSEYRAQYPPNTYNVGDPSRRNYQPGLERPSNNGLRPGGPSREEYQATLEMKNVPSQGGFTYARGSDPYLHTRAGRPGVPRQAQYSGNTRLRAPAPRGFAGIPRGLRPNF